MKLRSCYYFLDKKDSYDIKEIKNIKNIKEIINEDMFLYF
jgi:hypothetical protein